MMMFRGFFLSLALLAMIPTNIVHAQAEGASSSGPSGIPAEVEGLVGGGVVAPNETAAPDAPPVDLSTLSGDQFIYTTLRVLTKGNPRGCGVSDWACMSRLCKQDLGPNAWRGWAGCNPHNNDFICYFECALVRDTF